MWYVVGIALCVIVVAPILCACVLSGRISRQEEMNLECKEYKQ